MSNQLFFLSLADIFSVYPAIFKDILHVSKKPKKVYLPSDAEWQEQMYYVLLEMQKQVNEAMDGGLTFENISRKDKPIFDILRTTKYISPTSTPSGRRSNPLKYCHPTAAKIKLKSGPKWQLHIIAKAAKLLRKPALPVEFRNEHEMRLTYSLIYDVFRYKVVLANALNDVNFYVKYKQYVGDERRIWIMLFELYDRQFKARNAEDNALQEQLYKDADVTEIVQHLWLQRMKLAAAMARMRVRFGALRLSKLLPIHLQNEKVARAVANPVVTGWINPFLIKNKAEADKLFTDMGFTIHGPDEEKPLLMQQIKWDNICPLFLSCIPKDRNEFTKSKLMTKHYFIMQDKNFSFGPAIMSKLLDYFELNGDVLQTHIDSPRSTAYLAALFYSVNRLNNFYVYGAGSNLKEYCKYMELIGVNNIRLFADSFHLYTHEWHGFHSVVGIFATPPNSFSAISDPIDLICSRGGDLSMLEVLTEPEISAEGKQRVALILEEQLLTLYMAMSRPQVQFVLYQTHSIVDTENRHMIEHVLTSINQLALEQHRNAYREIKRLQALAEAETHNMSAAAAIGNVAQRKKKNALTEDDKRKSQADLTAAKSNIANMPVVPSNDVVEVPDIDEFVAVALPDICINQDNCIKTQATGCFLSLVQRKKITHLNEKYLIRMAEQRGLFGQTINANEKLTIKTKSVKLIESKNLQKQMLDNRLERDMQRKCAKVQNVLARLLQCTNASRIRSNLAKISAQQQPIIFNFKQRHCSRILPIYMRNWHSALGLNPGPTKLKFSIHFNRKLRIIKRNCRQHLPLHIQNLELCFKLCPKI